ncbi:hypothetical protein MRX96_055219 [Rhipicephalus microplus]
MTLGAPIKQWTPHPFGSVHRCSIRRTDLSLGEGTHSVQVIARATPSWCYRSDKQEVYRRSTRNFTGSERGVPGGLYPAASAAGRKWAGADSPLLSQENVIKMVSFVDKALQDFGKQFKQKQS